MFTLTLVDLQYETSVPMGIWNDDPTKMILLPSFQLATRLNSQNTNETEFINERWHINLFMNICISNWNNRSFDLTKMLFLNLFQFLTRLITSKHLELFSTYLVGRNGTMWKTCFSATLNAKKEIPLKHKNQVRKRLLIDS